MGQVTIYLEDDVEEKMRSSAKATGLSQSKWVANLIKEKVMSEWPDTVKQLAGAWEDLPTLEEIRATNTLDSPREDL
ncbi:MAG: CopG family transcriptional regulator [Thermodesulfobacteriota bacterium]|nr:CopG family transcriptional regulator [Thermodesulfobacteriota bacterium]